MSVKRSFATHLIPRIATQLRCSRNPPNIRNPLIYCVNRYFLIFELFTYGDAAEGDIDYTSIFKISLK